MNGEVRILWDEYETAILIDACLRYNRGEISKKDAVRETSQVLRQMAVNKRKIIDEIYRNENGISLKFETINGLIKHVDNGFEPSKMFKAMVEIMETNKARYDEILKEAKNMVQDNRKKQEAFFEWLLKRIKTEVASNYFFALSEYEKFAKKRGYINTSVFEIEEPDKVDNICNKMFANPMLQNLYRKNASNIKKIAGYYKEFLIEQRGDKGELTEQRQEEEPKTAPGEVILDFDKGLIFEDSIPVEMECMGRKYTRLMSWKFVYARFMQVIYGPYENKIKKHIGTSLMDDGVIDITTKDNKEKLSEPLPIVRDIFLDVGFDDDIIVKKIKKWLEVCNIPRRYIVIKYNKNTGERKTRTYTQSRNISTENKKQLDNAIIKLDLNNKADMAYTKPVYFIYNGKDQGNVSSWADTYIRFMKRIAADFPKKVHSRVGRSVMNDGKIDIAARIHINSMRKPKQITPSLFVETNLSANDIVKKIAQWLYICGLGPESIEIGYRKADTVVSLPEKHGAETAQARKPIVQSTETENYKKVLKEKFPRGYKVDSSIELKKFKRAYENIFQRTTPDSDEVILRTLKNICVRYEKNIYLPESMLCEEKRNSILAYIQSELSNGKNAVYYDILFDRFAEELEDECIYNAEMLEVYLENTCRGEYYFGKTYLSNSYTSKVDPEKEARKFLIEKAMPVSVDEIVTSLSYIPESDIKAALSKSINILKNSQTEYFDASIIDLTQNEMRCIEHVINSLIYKKGYAIISEIIEMLKSKYPDIYDRFQLFSEHGIMMILKFKLDSGYSIKGKTIRKIEEEKSLTDIYVSYAKDHDTFTIDELKAIKDEFGSIINFDKVYENSVRVSQRDFVSRNLVHFDIDSVDEIIDDYCQGDYIPISAITQFGTFPDCGYAWNSFLLEHYVADFSKKYMLLHARYNEKRCVGAIAKRAAGIESYDELIIRVLAECGLELTNDAALNYLFANGYIASRSYRDIDNMIHKAKQKRAEEGM